MCFICPKVFFACIIPVVTSVQHLPSADIHVPRYLKLLICFNVLLFNLTSHVGGSFLFGITIVSVFLILKLNSYFYSLLFVVTRSSNASSVPVILLSIQYRQHI